MTASLLHHLVLSEWEELDHGALGLKKEDLGMRSPQFQSWLHESAVHSRSVHRFGPQSF